MTLLVYGAYGYTGELVAETAVERGLDPVLAGRNARKLGEVAARLDCESRAFALDESPESHLDGVDVALNCAGPFVDTAGPLASACLATGTDYLDITGELPVFESLAAHDDDAADAGVTLLPGVGFDVVPTDCLAAHLVERLPDATHLAPGFEPHGGLSPGTAVTAVRQAGDGGAVRRDGRIVSVPPPTASAASTSGTASGRRSRSRGATCRRPTTRRASRTSRCTSRCRRTRAASCGVFATSHLSSTSTRSTTSCSASSAGSSPARTPRRVPRVGRSSGEARDERTGETVVSRLVTPETYALTVDAATATAQRALDGEAPDGFQTPSTAFGADFVLSLDGVERTDE